mmetsp:Transcript_21367/g.46153  ORF Transcript_21367/g.46153 Transcript_21367/m.46153 type:complete len:209 (+) Transcript_21367:567-1193(+)
MEPRSPVTRSLLNLLPAKVVLPPMVPRSVALSTLSIATLSTTLVKAVVFSPPLNVPGPRLLLAPPTPGIYFLSSTSSGPKVRSTAPTIPRSGFVRRFRLVLAKRYATRLLSSSTPLCLMASSVRRKANTSSASSLAATSRSRPSAKSLFLMAALCPVLKSPSMIPMTAPSSPLTPVTPLVTSVPLAAISPSSRGPVLLPALLRTFFLI